MFLTIGAITNPALQNIFKPQLTFKTINALPQSFDMPDNVFPSYNSTVTVQCKVISANFVVGEPVGIFLDVSFDDITTRHCVVLNVEGEPVNAMDYWVNVIPEIAKGFSKLHSSHKCNG